MAGKKLRAATTKAQHVRKPQAGSITRPRAEANPHLDWGGVRIMIPPTAVVHRILPGRAGRTTPIEVDLRAYVASVPSAVVKHWLSEHVSAAIAAQPLLAPAGSVGQITSYDTMAHLVADIVFAEIPYEARNGSAWQLPEETIARRRGDCEDRAVLLASALVAAGVSPYNVRVALGSVAVKLEGGRAQQRAHAWVVYRAEDGTWTALEPVPNRGASRNSPLIFKYQPDYVFNGDHQWSMTSHADHDNVMRERWNGLDPTFHGEVHKSIVEHAAALAKLPDPLRTRIARTFTTLFGNVIDNPDFRFRSYDPRDHFDSGLIADSWARAQTRLDRFYAAPITDSNGTNNACWAVHAIADFYAHSTYAHFLESEQGKGVQIPYNPKTQHPALRYDYAADEVFSKLKFTHYAPWCDTQSFDRLANWKGRAISGRYSFSNDSQDNIERLTNVPPADAFPTPSARQVAGSLPHHNEIAVDEAGEHSNAIYPSQRYVAQFNLRYALAVQHIANVLRLHPALPG